MERFSTLEEERDALKRQVDSLESEATDAFDRGVDEGHHQVRGAEFSESILVLPHITSKTTASDDSLILMAECDDANIPLSGCRFTVVVKHTNDVKGVVEVIDVQHRGGSPVVVSLACTERTSPSFWEHLEENALHDPAAPSGIELVTYLVPDSANHFKTLITQESESTTEVAEA